MIAPYLAAIDDEIRAQLVADTPELASFYEMMRYHLGLDASVARGGKRLRPLLCLLLHEATGGASGGALPAAAAIELLHNFTLIHDDIEDQDETRHHRATLWARFGVAQAINAGDGMYAISRVAVQRLRAGGVAPERVLETVAALDRAAVRVCEGQFLDISFEGRIDVSEERYREMIARKTGALFRAPAEIAAVLSGCDARSREALVAFGQALGLAYQAHDDRKGMWGSASETGKTEMNDIAKRKMTLPLVLAVGRASAAQAAIVRLAYARPAPLPPEEVRRVREVVDALAVHDDVDRFVTTERERALSSLARAELREPARTEVLRLVAEATGASASPAARA
ncbi:MAG: polyprenyl synthetase family protein [Chloroflexi bacterium]|nr:MAG: polyprenyl synthetase family protein [Chloroflexota bacterium]